VHVTAAKALDGIHAQFDGLHREHRELQQENTRLQADATALRAALAQAGDQVVRLQQENDTLRQENTALQERLDDAIAQAPAYDPLPRDEDWWCSPSPTLAPATPPPAVRRRPKPGAVMAVALLLALTGIVLSPLVTGTGIPIISTAVQYGGLLAHQGTASVSAFTSGLIHQVTAGVVFLTAQPGLGMFVLIAGVLTVMFIALNQSA
jgi:regulator of replication initiation timing